MSVNRTRDTQITACASTSVSLVVLVKVCPQDGDGHTPEKKRPSHRRSTWRSSLSSFQLPLY